MFIETNRSRITKLSESNIALLTEGGYYAVRDYKHCPPDGGRRSTRFVTINIALLAEGGTTRPVLHGSCL